MSNLHPAKNAVDNESKYWGGVFQTVVSRLKSPGSCRNGYCPRRRANFLGRCTCVLVSGAVSGSRAR